MITKFKFKTIQIVDSYENENDDKQNKNKMKKINLKCTVVENLNKVKYVLRIIIKMLIINTPIKHVFI